MKRLVAWMAGHGVASNLLWIALLIVGLVSAWSLEQEVFPEFALDVVQVRVDYPGAGPAEVEDSILRRIEERIEGIEGIDELRSIGREGVGIVTAELQRSASVSAVRRDIEAEVNRITTFPASAERPIVSELTNRRRVLRLALHGDRDPADLKRLAYTVEERLTAVPEINDVRVAGSPGAEIDIRVSTEALRAYGLTLPDVALAVGRNSLDLPAGALETREREIVVRTEGRNLTAEDFRDLVILATPNGASLRLGDVAEVQGGPSTRSDERVAIDGEPAVFVDVFRTDGQQVLAVTGAALDAVDGEIRNELPPDVTVTVWQNQAETLRSRLSLLVRNGALGLGLVLVVLTLFLDLRVAFWVAVGIGVSFVGAFGILEVTGASINQLSLFGFVLALGIVVDDAIIVGENIHAAQERDEAGDPEQAAVAGASRVIAPVSIAVVTTMIAFSPLLFVPGTIGKITQNIPIVVIAVLGLSLVESLLVLPHHLSNRGEERWRDWTVVRAIDRARNKVSGALARFVQGPLARFLRMVVRSPGLTLCVSLAVLLWTAGLVSGGWLRFQFLPSIEGNVVRAQITMPPGTSAARTEAVAERIVAAGREAEATFDTDLVEHVQVYVGRHPSSDGGPGGSTGLVDPTKAEVAFELLQADERDVLARDFELAWRESVGEVPGPRSLVFAAELVSLGAPVSVSLSASDEPSLSEVVEEVRDALAELPGVVDIQDDRGQGRPEVEVRPTPRARQLGLTLESLAGQLRGALFGTEALRVQREREEVRVYVRLPAEQRDSISDLASLRVRTPSGGLVPIEHVADLELSTGPSVIRREGGKRVVTVTADVDPGVTSGQQVSDALRSDVLADLSAARPGFAATFGGEQESQTEALTAMARTFGLALVAIYVLLAVPFRSYRVPLLILAAIPFGLVGAALGHLLLGLPVTILSLFGLVGLSGVMVNDALVLVDFTLEERSTGHDIEEALVRAAQARFRPVLLTSLTTFFGVAPLIFEGSVQARFLVPMAVSLGFGVLLGTVVMMAVVPALVRIALGASSGQRAST